VVVQRQVFAMERGHRNSLPRSQSDGEEVSSPSISVITAE
jgi:hypothetical protein